MGGVRAVEFSLQRRQGRVVPWLVAQADLLDNWMDKSVAEALAQPLW